VTRASAFLVLAAANLMWAGNWVLGRAVREDFAPVALNFWRWAIAVLVLAPFALPKLKGKGVALRQHAGILFLLALVGVALFQSLVYLGLRTTTTVNAVLLNSSGPAFILLCAWVMDRERASWRQVGGMLLSLAGILVIMTRGELARLAQFEFHAGDAWILLAILLWGIYSVLLKRRPAEFSGTELLFVMSAAGVLLLAPAYVVEMQFLPQRMPGAGVAAGVLYIGLFASVAAFICWNKGVAAVGPNAAGFTLHLLPAFATVLAILLLGETFQAFHAAGIATILAGVIVATRQR
jgi:drug/metabolite transporter (DMT)-like permease